MLPPSAMRRALLPRGSAGMMAARTHLPLTASPLPSHWRRCFATPSFADATPLPMPALSPTMTHGNVASWNLKEGDKVEAGTVICEIETDKATVDFEAQDDGFLAKIIVPAGTSDVPVGKVIGFTVEEEDQVEGIRQLTYVDEDSGTSNPVALGSSTPPSPPPSTGSGKQPRTSPAARHLLESYGVPPSEVVGTGKGGVITKADALSVVKGRSLAALPPPQKSSNVPPDSTATPRPPRATTEPVPSATPRSLSSSGASYVDVPVSTMRKVIASRLTESKTQVPHFYCSIGCNIDRALEMRKQLKKQLGAAPSVNDIIIKAVGLALRDVPAVNRRVEGGVVVANDSVDVSVAVATPSGLITPIVRDAHTKGLLAITEDMRDLAARARVGKLKPEEYQGGCFSVSNLGMFGIDSFTAVINPPQAGILAIGQGQPVARVPVVQPPQSKATDNAIAYDEVEFDTMMNVSVSCDRRVVDDVEAARFLQTFRAYMENPMFLSV